jgi:16S rRNA (cytosine967-C5)-methyltransferase
MHAGPVPAAPGGAHAAPLARLLDQAADAVAAVVAGRSLDALLARCPPELRAGTQALAFHGLRWLAGARAVRELLAPKPPPPAVDALLLLALALLWPASEPPYAEHTLVDQAVNAARTRTPAAAGFINAVLRRFLRERDALVAAAQHQPAAAFQHPLWWIERVRQDWPLSWAAILAAANRQAPMVLRVNLRRCSVADYLGRLAAAGRAARALGGEAVLLAQPCAVADLPGFGDGEVSVQDLSAQRAAPLLLGAGSSRLRDGARVLDACAAPGGKTAHLLELARLDILALDRDAQRLARVHDTLHRLHLPIDEGAPASAPEGTGNGARLLAADARDTARWWDGQPFDAILLDAPCTASGIVRRHPDVRWLRRPDDVAALARTQAELLDALWPLLRPGGRLLYATCSIFRAEGQQQIDAFLQRHAGQQPRLDPASPGHLLGVPDNRASPSADAALGDGFFYALIHKP